MLQIREEINQINSDEFSGTPGGRYPERGVGLSRSHELGIRPRPSHIAHGASQDHWRGSLSSRLHSNRPRPPHPGQRTVGPPLSFSGLRKIRFRKLPAIPIPPWVKFPQQYVLCHSLSRPG
jgi:hypothetical protein